MSPSRPSSHYLVAYLLWVVSFVLGAVIIYLALDTILTVIVILSSSQDLTSSEQFYRSRQIAAAVPWSYICMGLLVIIELVFLESFYRTGVQKGVFWRRFFLVTWIETAVLLVNHIVFYAMRAAYIPLTTVAVGIIVVESIVTGLFVWLWSKSRKSIPV